GVSAVLILGSAFLLFNPFVQRVGFGFAPGVRARIVNSGQVIAVSNTSPTPSASGATPTPTPPHPRATATRAPTAVPTATPKPTPTPVLGPATVTFTRTAKPLSVAQTMTACTGCSFNAAGGVLAAVTNTYNNQVPYGGYTPNAQTVQTSPGTQEIMSL